ncbi:MAG: biopolymer transporter ExbD [candidate division WOR-3 bacterium]
MEFKEKIKRKPAIPTASMGDIAFLIIIFFMTTSIFSREKGLKIVLPEKGQEVKIKSENILTVQVNPQGEVLIGDKIITIPEVRSKVAEALAENKELVVALRVSRSAPYKTMIDVFDELKLAKAERISLIPVKEEGAQ